MVKLIWRRFVSRRGDVATPLKASIYRAQSLPSLQASPWKWFGLLCSVNLALFFYSFAAALLAMVPGSISMEFGTQSIHLGSGSLLLMSLAGIAAYGAPLVLRPSEGLWRYSVLVCSVSIGTLYALPLGVAGIVALLDRRVRHHYGVTDTPRRYPGPSAAPLWTAA